MPSVVLFFFNYHSNETLIWQFRYDFGQVEFVGVQTKLHHEVKINLSKKSFIKMFFAQKTAKIFQKKKKTEKRRLRSAAHSPPPPPPKQTKKLIVPKPGTRNRSSGKSKLPLDLKSKTQTSEILFLVS